MRPALHAFAGYGIELEINHRHVLAGGPHWRRLRRDVVASLRHALAECGHCGQSGTSKS